MELNFGELVRKVLGSYGMVRGTGGEWGLGRKKTILMEVRQVIMRDELL